MPEAAGEAVGNEEMEISRGRRVLSTKLIERLRPQQQYMALGVGRYGRGARLVAV